MKIKKKPLLLNLAAALLWALPASQAFAGRVVFVPLGSGQAGSGFFNIQNAFDTQPNIADLSVDKNLVARDGGAGTGLGLNPSELAGRAGYIDFGPNFASVQIIELWTAYRSNSSNATTTAGGYHALWWSSGTDTNRVAGTYTDITNPNFNFGLKGTDGDNSNFVMWRQDAVFDVAITPAYRYLILSTGAGVEGEAQPPLRITELAIVAIPEPGTLALMGIAFGAMLLGHRRWRR